MLFSRKCHLINDNKKRNLKKLRLELIEHFQNPLADLSAVEKCFNSYLSFFLGLIDDQNSGQNSGDQGPNIQNLNINDSNVQNNSNDASQVKLRYLIKFKWSQSLLGNVPM